jgi:hypothetical protein
MKKLLLLLPLVVTACSDDKNKHIEQVQPVIIQPQGVPTQPVAPIIINQQPAQQSNTGDTITNMAVGALAAHAISGALNDNKDTPTHTTIIKEKTVYVDRPVEVQHTTSNPAQVQPFVPVKSSMNMDKLSESAKQPVLPPAAQQVKSSLDMSKLSATPKMNLSKLSRK